jgi:hypothetical protein
MKKLLLILCVLLMAMPAYALDITLTWDANTEPDMDHYVLYWGTASGDYANNDRTAGLETTKTVTIPNDDQVYYFALTAVDTSGLESDFSNEVSTEGLMPDDYLYLPPASPTGNTILNAFNTFPDGTTIQITEPGHAVVTYPNGMVIEIVGTVVTVTPPPE